MARALMPMDDASSKRFSFRYTSIGMITHAVKTKGVKKKKKRNIIIAKS
jgi:hypothetical protein